MSANILEQAMELIRMETVPERPAELDRALQYCVSQVRVGTIDYFERNGVKSILVYNTAQRPPRFTIILNGHLDVIPGKPEQYVPRVLEGRLFGVGATDMKANVACIIEAFNEMAPRVSYPLGLQIVTDEEIGGFDGTMYQIEQGVRADFVIAAESTNFNIVNQAKGVLWAALVARGKTAHGAYPWRGQNAIQKMVRFLNAVEAEYGTPTEEQWCTTVNVSAIQSDNRAYNKIPDHCAVSLDLRFLPAESKNVLSRLQQLVPSDFEFEVKAHEPALYVDSSNPFLQNLKQATQQVRNATCSYYCAQGSSDARHYTRVGDAGVEFGPIGGGIGTDEEWVDLASLDSYIEILQCFLLGLGQNNGLSNVKS
jgi:succinyl-diaminopimelate desuccinylase